MNKQIEHFEHVRKGFNKLISEQYKKDWIVENLNEYERTNFIFWLLDNYRLLPKVYKKREKV